MKLPTFDINLARWDKYRAFHIEYACRYQWQAGSGQIIVFDTGELVILGGIEHTDLRRKYDDFRFSIISTADTGFPSVATSLLHGVIKVPLAWLNDGGQYICLWDHDTGKVYNLNVNGAQSMALRETIPSRFSRLNVVGYWAGYDRPFQSIGFELSAPQDKQAKADLQAMIDACKAWDQIRRLDPHFKPDKGISAWNTSKLDPHWIIKTGFAGLSDRQRELVVRGHIGKFRKTITVPYLQTSKEK